MNKQTIDEAINGKQILVTGGTGSFGHEIVQELTRYSPSLIRIFSRDEKKQYDMQQSFNDNRLHFTIGDVRDFRRVEECMQGIDLVFHAAALKQVPSCEFAPNEAVLTNINGAENIRNAALKCGVNTVIAISTDKAVKPVNVMGMSKAIQERIFLQPTRMESQTKFVCVRYGNVLGSRGSVVPLFKRIICDGNPLPITHPNMTRFQLTLNQAVQLVLQAASVGKDGELWVRKMSSAKITSIGQVLAKGLIGSENYPQVITGMRPGEKMHEILVSEEEMWRTEEREDYFIIPNWSKPINASLKSIEKKFKTYASNSVYMMNDEEIYELLKSNGWFDRSQQISVPLHKV